MTPDEINTLIVEGTPNAYLVCNADLLTLFANKRFETLFKFQPQHGDHIPTAFSWLLEQGTHPWEGPLGLTWIQVHRETFNGQLLFCYVDVSESKRLREENEQLRQELQERLGTDRLTGLLNYRALMQILEPQIARSRRYHNPLSVVLMRIKPFLFDAAESANLDDDNILAVARLLKDQMRWADQIGRFDEAAFLLVLPETSGKDAQMLTQKIKKGIDILNQNAKKKVIADFGLSEWTKGDDLHRLLGRAKENCQ